MDLWSHTNDTIGQIRRQILYKVKANSNIKIDLYLNGEILDPAEDKRLISQLPIREKTVSVIFTKVDCIENSYALVHCTSVHLLSSFKGDTKICSTHRIHVQLIIMV